MKNKIFLVVLLFNLLIALGFYFENIGVGYSELSSDLHNSIPVAIKLDNPNLFQGDLYLSNIDDVKYYTPFFVNTVRFFTFFSGSDYLKGINLMSFFLHLIYGVSWFLLFQKIYKNSFLSFFLSILVRGIVWLPGYEIWGISDLWTMMPRTIYIALLPIPFILLLSNSKIKVYLSAFLIGWIMNFHPITGLGGILIYVLVLFYLIKNNLMAFKNNQLIVMFFLLLAGMLPFVTNYIFQTSASQNYEIELYKEAFNARIPSLFGNELEFLAMWKRKPTLFFLLPLLLYFIYGFYKKKHYKKVAFFLVLTTLILVFLPTISITVERFVNNWLGLNIRMSFQLVRIQKMAILPGLIAMGYLLKEIINNFPIKSSVKVIFLIVFVVVLIFSKETFFNQIPFVRDDIARSIFPDLKQFKQKDKLKAIDKMCEYIKVNTNESDVFMGYPMIRCATNRSVVLDSKGASMLIEGNPLGLMKWYKEIEEIKNCQTTKDSLKFFKKKKVNYLVLNHRNSVLGLKPIHKEESICLFKLD